MDVNFTALAPRYGTHPIVGSFSGLGTAGMNGGAFNWGSVWSGVKSFGNAAKGWANKAWKSNTGNKLREKLHDTGVQDKLIDGINMGIHGALDLAQQEVARVFEKRLERPIQPYYKPNISEKELEVELEPTRDLTLHYGEPPSYEEAINERPPMTKIIREYSTPVLPSYNKPKHKKKKKPEILEKVTTVEEQELPPPYSLEAFAPVTETVPSVMVEPAAPLVAPSLLNKRGWQSTLNNIVGVGIQSSKRRKCF